MCRLARCSGAFNGVTLVPGQVCNLLRRPAVDIRWQEWA